MALLNQVSGLQSVPSSFHPLFPWNIPSTGNDWNVPQEDALYSTTSYRMNQLQRKKVPSTKHQGPIAHRNSNVTIRPQLAYPMLKNGSLIQIPVG